MNVQCNRIEFTKNMNCNISLEEVIKGYFDETMAIYDLVESYYSSNVRSNFGTNSFEVVLSFNNKKDAMSTCNLLSNNNRICKYGREFTYIPKHINKEVIIMIEEVNLNG